MPEAEKEEALKSDKLIVQCPYEEKNWMQQGILQKHVEKCTKNK